MSYQETDTNMPGRSPAQIAVINSRNQLLAAWGSMEEATAELEQERRTAREVEEFHRQGEGAAILWVAQINTALYNIRQAQNKLEGLLG